MSGDSLPLALPLASVAADACEVTVLYRELRKPLLRYLVCLGLSGDEAQDVVQDAFLSLHRHLASGGSQDNIRGWVLSAWRTTKPETGKAVITGVLANRSMARMARWTRSWTKRRQSAWCWRRKDSASWEKRISLLTGSGARMPVAAGRRGSAVSRNPAKCWGFRPPRWAIR